MTEKVPCPVCARPMKPRHTKGTDFMPRHDNPQGERCSGTTAVVNAKPHCEDCGQTTCPKAPVSDSAPTVEPMGDVTGTTEDNHSQADPEKVPCPRCGRETAIKNDGQPYKHNRPGSERPCVPGDTPVTVRGDLAGRSLSDPASTVEPVDDTPVPADHRPGRPPAQAEVDYWQRQAREAAQRHFETSEGDTPYVELLKEELAEDRAPLVEIRIPAAPGPMPTPDEFMDPAEPEVKLNVSGQPKARRDWQGRYIVVDPDLGDFRRTVREKKPKGITRATTFNKAAQNTTHLNLWGKANVARGASLRPDILRRAHGLTWDDNKDELLRIVDELETAAGAKVAADEGTFLHEFCDQVDAGLKTWQDAPAAYQQDIRRYVEELANEGLEPVPGLIERTTFIREYGGVAGTFDRVFYHRPSGQYIVGDLKTGKTMKYAMDETECQLFTYAHGVNQWGVYDWNTDTWCPALDGTEERHYADQVPEQRYIKVSEKVGVIIHMPVQGPEAGEVCLRYADLECGRAYAELNHAVRSYPKSKVRPFVMPSAEPVEPAERPWEGEFRGVRSKEGANALWREAKAAGISGERLEALVDLARQSIRLHSWQGLTEPHR